MIKKFTILAITFAILAVAQPANAQQAGKVYRIGLIMTGMPKDHGNLLKFLRQGLKELGYVEGQNIIFEPRFDMRDRKRLRKLAEELLGLKVDVIVVTGSGAARAARKASPSVPIVVAVAGNLVGSGIVASLARPGGNTTGNTAYSGQLGGKQLQLLKDGIPRLKRVAVLYRRPRPSGVSFDRMKAAGLVLGVEVQEFGVRDKGEFKGAFAAMAKSRADALILIVSRLISVHRKELIKLAARQKLPTMCWRPSMARNGCFMSYGADRNAMYRRAATFVHKILQGAKPGDLPVEQPSKFGLAINLKTAKALGITVPQSLLLRADEVIE